MFPSMPIIAMNTAKENFKSIGYRLLPIYLSMSSDFYNNHGDEGMTYLSTNHLGDDAILSLYMM